MPTNPRHGKAKGPEDSTPAPDPEILAGVVAEADPSADASDTATNQAEAAELAVDGHDNDNGPRPEDGTQPTRGDEVAVTAEQAATLGGAA